jgi:hypothetical protein
MQWHLLTAGRRQLTSRDEQEDRHLSGWPVFGIAYQTYARKEKDCSEYGIDDNSLDAPGCTGTIHKAYGSHYQTGDSQKSQKHPDNPFFHNFLLSLMQIACPRQAVSKGPYVQLSTYLIANEWNR